MGRLIKLFICFTLTLLGLQGLASANDDQTHALNLLEMGDILPLEKILEISRQKITGNILEVELEHDADQPDSHLIYELEILDKQGKVWELRINAKSGEFIKHE